MLKKLIITLAVLSSVQSVMAQSPQIYASDGQYLGNMSSNPYDPNSTSNPYGAYGSPYSSTSVNNPYSQYGSPYSNMSPNNPYATGSYSRSRW